MTPCSGRLAGAVRLWGCGTRCGPRQALAQASDYARAAMQVPNPDSHWRLLPKCAPTTVYASHLACESNCTSPGQRSAVGSWPDQRTANWGCSHAYAPPDALTRPRTYGWPAASRILRLDTLLGMDDLTTRADELDGVALAWLTIDAERDVRSAHVELGQLDARGRIEAASLERLEERRLGEGARAHPHPAPTRVGVERTVRLVVMGIVCGQPVGPATEPEEVV